MQPIPTRIALATTAVVLGSLGTASAVGLQAARSPLGTVLGAPEAAASPPHLTSPAAPQRPSSVEPPVAAPATVPDLLAQGHHHRRRSGAVPPLGGVADTVHGVTGTVRGVTGTVRGVSGAVDKLVRHVPRELDRSLRHTLGHALHLGHPTPVTELTDGVRRQVARGIRRDLLERSGYPLSRRGHQRSVNELSELTSSEFSGSTSLAGHRQLGGGRHADPFGGRRGGSFEAVDSFKGSFGGGIGGAGGHGGRHRLGY